MSIVANNTIFDYSILDNETANFLNEKEKAIKTIVIESATEIGKHLKEAQDKLSLKGYGCFGEWLKTSFSFSDRTAYKLIERYDFVSSNLHLPNVVEVFENLPKCLSYEISKPSAPKELVEATLNGDITSHKQYRMLENKLEDLDNFIRSKRKLRKEETIIYFLYDRQSNIVKIGETHNLSRRVKELQDCRFPYPLELMYSFVAPYYTEKQLHKKFSKHHLKNEWFRYDTEIENYIKQLKQTA